MFQIRMMVFSAASLVSCLLAMIAMISMIALGSLVVSFLKSLPQNRLWCYLWSFWSKFLYCNIFKLNQSCLSGKTYSVIWTLPWLSWQSFECARGYKQSLRWHWTTEEKKMIMLLPYYDMMILPNCVFRAPTPSFDYCLDRCLLWQPPSGRFNSKPNLITYMFETRV